MKHFRNQRGTCFKILQFRSLIPISRDSRNIRPLEKRWCQSRYVNSGLLRLVRFWFRDASSIERLLATDEINSLSRMGFSISMYSINARQLCGTEGQGLLEKYDNLTTWRNAKGFCRWRASIGHALSNLSYSIAIILDSMKNWIAQRDWNPFLRTSIHNSRETCCKRLFPFLRSGSKTTFTLTQLIWLLSIVCSHCMNPKIFNRYKSVQSQWIWRQSRHCWQRMPMSL